MRPNVQNVIEKIESVKSNVMCGDVCAVQNAWETVHTEIGNKKISVDKNTMGTRNLVEDVASMDLNARDAPNIPYLTAFHLQKVSNLCVQFAEMSAVRHEMKKIIKNSESTAVNMLNEFPTDKEKIPIPADKLINQLFEEKEFEFVDPVSNKKENFPNALNFESMLSVLLGCVSPRPLSGLVKTFKIHFEIIIFFK